MKPTGERADGDTGRDRSPAASSAGRGPDIDWRWALAIAVATLVAYAPALGGAFLWNDSDYVTNPALRSLDGLRRIWWEPGVTEQYYPLLHSAFWLEHRLWGDSPFGYHLVNVVLHAVAAGLFGGILQKLRVPGAWLGAALFALHPVGVESVAWISEQKNTLSLVCYLLAAWTYLRFDESRTMRTYLGALGWFGLALLSKTVTATLPGALLVVLWWRRGRLGWRSDIAPLVPWFALGAAQGLFTRWVESKFIGAEGAEFVFSAAQRVLMAGRMTWFYLGKLVFPANLTFVYPRWDVRTDALWQYWFPVAALALVVALWWMRGRARGPLAAVLFFGGSLFPVLGFFNVYFYRYSFVGDHFQYLASLGMFALAGAGLAILARGVWSRRLMAEVGVGAMLFALALATMRQTRMFRDNRSLWTTALARNPACWLAENHLGVMATETGRTDEALRRLGAVLRARPDDPDVHSNFGSALLQAGRATEAMEHLQRSLHLKPLSPEACNNLGNAHLHLGRTAEAMASYQRALRLNPGFATAHSNLGGVLLRLGRADEALPHLETALRFNPTSPDTLNNLAGALLALGRGDAALAHYGRAVRLRPDHIEAWSNYGIALGQNGRYREARACFEQALRLKPDHAAARENLARLAAAERAAHPDSK